MGSAPPVDDDLSLPKATVQKMISGPKYVFCCEIFSLLRYSELLPKDITCAKETRDLIIECCVGKLESHLAMYDLTRARIHTSNFLRCK